MKLIGKELGSGFRILQEIARGTVARVYLASDGHTLRVVKLFPVEYRARAAREFALGRDLVQPHLNPVAGEIEVEGLPGVWMAYVPGKRFDDWFDGGERCSERLFNCFDGVLAALAYLHERGIVHQDLKPENILVDKQDFARLLDFDLATLEGEPQAWSFAGTIAYLSPEQARGEAATHLSDLYAAGVILYQGLTGQVPFTGSVAEVMIAHRQLKPETPSSLLPALTPFDDFFAKLLAKEAWQRFQSAAEVVQTLAVIRSQSGDIRLAS